jgi:alkanesulfonate monooxygenase SsuD/methylene tetrahydromethanopterin reductase-like flavin-dependent oxidoreductase (luciferase family)
VSEPGYDPALLTPDGMREVAQAAERVGLDAIAFTDHPAPFQRRLDAGGQRRRAADHQGWSPLMIDETLARTTRTPALGNVEQLAAAVADLRDLAAAARGAEARVDVQVQTPYSRWSPDAGSAEEHRDHLGRLAEAGETWFVLRPPGSGVQAAVESLEAYGELVGGL